MEVVWNQRGVNFLPMKRQMLYSYRPVRAWKESVHSFGPHCWSCLPPLCLHLVTPTLSSLPSSTRCSQTARWGSFHPAWWVCGACSWRDEPSEEVANQFQQGGGTECGDPRGGRQEDAGEARQREHHHLRPNSHEHGEVGEEKQRPPIKWDKYSSIRIMENNVDGTGDHSHW